ncbi:MAG: sugar isomerase [Phycisphaerales bacterium]|jgi:glutamine---fructose-6-phosphate transaminase (isomerizing)|nr:sugar isomerase [Phycisphaerales bacterium]
MNRTEDKYTQFALCKEMLETADVIRNFDPMRTAGIAETVLEKGKLLLTGEGSSRILPAKFAIRRALTQGIDIQLLTAASRLAETYKLEDFAIFAASNSGRTKEVIKLLQAQKAAGNTALFGQTAQEDNLLKDYTAETLVLKCGWENAVAATKSVVEQALIYQSLLCHVAKDDISDAQENKNALGAAVEEALTMDIPTEIIEAAAGAGVIHFAGHDDGVAEELTLKTNEITRKKSDFLEGTYACHGIEEVMDETDIIFVIDPILDEMEKFKQVLVDGVGATVVCIATAPVEQFPTLVIQDLGIMTPIVSLAAGWNLLVEIGISLGIDLDKPERARKVGNEFEG